MAGNWEFNKADPSSVRVEVTQRDQFNNDDVGLAEALVREVIQNSSDAGEGVEPVKVRFAIKTLDADEVALLESNLTPLNPHFEACGMDSELGTDEPVRVLSIEDFNTKGLTGSFEKLDKDNFDNFWRAVGKSEKSGRKGGRWGLGKLVYSSSSRAKVFFGMTVRKEEEVPSLMGQAVLANHCIGDDYFPAHGFWFDGRSENQLALQLPVQRDDEIENFRKFSNLSRTNQPGLSIIIPHLISGIDQDSIISGVVNNYYFPILAGKLVVEVGDLLINDETFLDVAGDVQSANTRVPFEFVKEISDAMKSPSSFVCDKSIGNAELDEKYFSEEKITEMKAEFSSGNLVHLRVPVTLKPKTGPEKNSYVHLFLKALPENESPFSLFARGPITLPRERNFSGAVARGAMIANDDDVAEFLGDAENPAHTAWNSNAEKLVARWHRPKPVLAAIRHSLRALYGIVAEQAEIQDNEALIDFFSLVDKAQASSGKKKKVVKPKVKIDPREKAIGIKPRNGGFEISAGPGAAKWDFPRTVRVRMAYDMIGANPFKRFSRFDFDLNKKSDVDLTAENADIEIVSSNIIKFVVHGPEFQLTAVGFDKRRDLVVDARAL